MSDELMWPVVPPPPPSKATDEDRERAREWSSENSDWLKGPYSCEFHDMLAEQFAAVREKTLRDAATHFDRRLRCVVCNCDLLPAVSLHRCAKNDTMCLGTSVGAAVSVELRALADGTLAFDRNEPIDTGDSTIPVVPDGTDEIDEPSMVGQIRYGDSGVRVRILGSRGFVSGEERYGLCEEHDVQSQIFSMSHKEVLAKYPHIQNDRPRSNVKR